MEFSAFSKIFENSFLKNGILELGSETIIVSIFIDSSTDKYVHNTKMISTKIVITVFRKKNRKLSFLFISKIQVMKDVYKKLKIKPIFIQIASFKNSNPDSVGDNSRFFDPRDSHEKSSLLNFG